MTSVGHFILDTEAKTSSHVIAAYLDAYTAPDGLVVDPFCQSPTLVVEAVRAGRRVVATNLNPLDALRTRVAVTPLSARDLDAAVTRLADSPKVGTSLQEHLLHLYRTACRHCNKTAIADYFIWERDQNVLKQVYYRCPACGESGIRDCDESDLRILQAVQPRGLHYWYVLERVARQEDRGRKFAEKLLELYTPRNLYVLSDLVRKIDDLFAGSPVHDFLRLALLQCLESSSKLNPVPGEQTPTHVSLNPPPRFVEWNVWQRFEEATRRLTQQAPSVTVTLAANVKDVASRSSTAEGTHTARAFVGRMSVRHLARELLPGSVGLVLTHPPQPGRTRWALPYLWTGWLYGHTESALLWPLLRRHASDWAWYLRAMRATLLALQKTLAPDAHIVFIGLSKGLAHYEALSLAAAGANLKLENALYHPRDAEVATRPFAGLRGDYRLTWTQGPPMPPWPMPPSVLRDRIGEASIAAAEEALEQRAEPAPFVRLHCAIWEALARRNLLQRVMSAQEPPMPPHMVREQVKVALEKEVGQTFVQLWRDEEKEECLWWLSQPPADVPPLTERVEQAAYEVLEAVEAIETIDFMQTVYARFPGALTPDAEWVTACLKSYGQPLAPDHWTLREEDRPAQRARAREAILRSLSELGQRVGYEVRLTTQGVDVQWLQAGKGAWAFVVLDSATLSRVLNLRLTGDLAQAQRFVILLAARQSLLHFKLTRFTWLRKQIAAKGWQFITDADLPEWANRIAQDRSQLPLV